MTGCIQSHPLSHVDLVYRKPRMLFLCLNPNMAWGSRHQWWRQLLGGHIKECIRPGLSSGDNRAHSAGPWLCWAAVVTGHFSMAVAATPTTSALQLGVESHLPLQLIRNIICLCGCGGWSIGASEHINCFQRVYGRIYVRVYGYMYYMASF